MTENDGSPFEVFRPDVPSPARMYDYYLGGKDHLPADRKAAEQFMKSLPPGMVRLGARQNRAFMQRAVRYIVTETDIRQFIDIGAGMPTMGPAHEIAQAIAPESHVVYVDYDPIVIAHGNEMLSGVSHATIIQYDIRDPEGIYSDPELHELIDFDRPVAVLLVAIMPFILNEENPRNIIRKLMDPLPSGSHLALSHVTADVVPEIDTATLAYQRAMSRAQSRSKLETAELLDGLDLVEPGLVWIPQWRPDAGTGLQDAPHKSCGYAAVARKPRGARRTTKPAVDVTGSASLAARRPAPRPLTTIPAPDPPRNVNVPEPAASEPRIPGPDPFTTFRPSVPSPARMYDYYLGGKDNLPADRKAARQIISAMPPGLVQGAARQNRAFMQRAVRYLVTETDVRQFVDIGAGLPTVGPVHEVAQKIAPESRIVYVDNDPMVIPHCWEMLSGVPNATVVRHDLRRPDDILTDPEVLELIDLDRPVAILLVAILHFISDDHRPAEIIRRLFDPLPAGSHLVLSHSTGDSYPPEAHAVEQVYRRATSTLHLRTKADVLGLLRGLELVAPGLVWVPRWRPDSDTRMQDSPEKSVFYAAVARKP